jgi:hypothetical protein
VSRWVTAARAVTGALACAVTLWLAAAPAGDASAAASIAGLLAAAVAGYAALEPVTGVRFALLGSGVALPVLAGTWAGAPAGPGVLAAGVCALLCTALTLRRRVPAAVGLALVVLSLAGVQAAADVHRLLPSLPQWDTLLHGLRTLAGWLPALAAWWVVLWLGTRGRALTAVLAMSVLALSFGLLATVEAAVVIATLFSGGLRVALRDASGDARKQGYARLADAACVALSAGIAVGVMDGRGAWLPGVVAAATLLAALRSGGAGPAARACALALVLLALAGVEVAPGAGAAGVGLWLALPLLPWLMWHALPAAFPTQAATARNAAIALCCAMLVGGVQLSYGLIVDTTVAPPASLGSTAD